MIKPLTTLTLLAVLAGSAARADQDCFVPMADWQPRNAVVTLAASNQWTVRRIKIDDGCYQIDGTDATGRQIEVTLHPGTLAVLEFEYEDEDDRPRRRDRTPPNPGGD